MSSTRQEIVFIGDKGFSSENNAKAFSAGELKYILPLKRGSRKEFGGVFLFDKKTHLALHAKRRERADNHLP